MTALAPSPAGHPGARLIDPSVLSRIGNLELIARAVVEGVLNGLHKSPHLGSSMDFAEHRAYMPGDDIRRIDWKLFGRSDRHYIKEFEADTNTNFTVMLDTSRSMRFGATPDGSRLSKLEYGRYLAACLSYLSSKQRDRVGLVTFDQEVAGYVPPSAKHLNAVLLTLDRIETGLRSNEPAHTAYDRRSGARPSTQRPSRQAPTRAAAPLSSITKRLAESFRRRSIIVLISDFYEDPTAVLDALAYLRGKGNDIIVFHLLDKQELEFPFTESASFVDLETGERMPVIPEYLRQQYRDLISAHTASLSKVLAGSRIDYALFDTSKPLDHALFSYLSTRERLKRIR